MLYGSKITIRVIPNHKHHFTNIAINHKHYNINRRLDALQTSIAIKSVSELMPHPVDLEISMSTFYPLPPSPLLLIGVARSLTLIGLRDALCTV